MRILAVAILMVFSQSLKASELFDGTLNVMGWVFTDDKPLQGAEVWVMDGNEAVAKHKTNRHGRFVIDLPLDRVFTLSIFDVGLVGKKLLFDTRVATLHTINDDLSFDFAIDLFESIPWIDKSFMEAPLITISFDNLANNFTFNQIEYANLRSRLDAINKVATIYEMRGSEYLNLLGQAEEYYLIGDFGAAHNQLSNALALFEGDTFVQNRLQLVERALHIDRLAQIADVDEIPLPTISQYPIGDSADKIENGSNMRLPDEYTYYTSHLIAETAQNNVVFSLHLTPDKTPNIMPGVFFMVQVLATKGKPHNNFFAPIIENLPEIPILLYRDSDGLNKFAVGKHAHLNDTMNLLRRLRSLNYETYIVAFANGRRVRVNKALELQRDTSK